MVILHIIENTFREHEKDFLSEQSLSYDAFVMKDNFQYSRTILHFQSTHTFSPVFYVSTKPDKNNRVVDFFVETVEDFIL